jgi:hypothetical protein
MTKKDFELIAKTIQNMTLEIDDKVIVARAFAIALKETNVNFKIDLFLDVALKQG